MDDYYTICLNALGSTAIISLAPVILLLFLPIDNEVNLKKSVALAIGCLLGDSFLHIIPHIAHGHHHHDEHDHNHHHGHHHDEFDHKLYVVALSKVLAGIVVFIILETAVNSINSKANNKPAKKKKSASDKAKKKKDDDYTDKHHHGHIHASGILNLIADFLHNFTDGIAIGASYMSGVKLGLSTTLAIFLHEVPHEISDYVILRRSGCSRTKAIWLQAVTAVGAFLGTAISLLLGSYVEQASELILPFTAGGFIYIAIKHLIPQLKNSDFKEKVTGLIYFVVGFGIMYMMVWLE